MFGNSTKANAMIAITTVIAKNITSPKMPDELSIVI
jgi:hypothetical protein